MSDFSHLVGTRHVDNEDGLLYETTRVIDQRKSRDKVSFDRLVLSDGFLYFGEEGPFHVGSILKLIKLSSDAGSHLGDSGHNQLSGLLFTALLVDLAPYLLDETWSRVSPSPRCQNGPFDTTKHRRDYCGP